MKAKKISQIGLLAAVAFVLGWLEQLVPFSIGIQGVKLGLANIAGIVGIEILGYKEALLVSCTRVVLVSITYGNMNAFFYSFAGMLFSMFVMVILHRYGKFSLVGISVAGGVAHNLGQLVVASLILNTMDLKYYAGFLILCGILTGVLNGVISGRVVYYIKNI